MSKESTSNNNFGTIKKKKPGCIRAAFAEMGCFPFDTDYTSDEEDEIRKRALARRHSRDISKQLRKEEKVYKATYRLLLLGAGESGKSTFVKQMKILHKNGFNDEEKMKMVEIIKGNIRDAILSITDALSTLTPPVELEFEENQKRINWICDNSLKPDFTYPPEFYNNVEELWKDGGIQAAYERSNEYQLIDSAKYFLDRVNIVREANFSPTEQDILRCRVLTDAIVETRFQINHVNFHLFDVGGQKIERKKWVQCFYDVTAIIFVTAASSYNLTLREDPTQNRLTESLSLFSQIWHNRWLLTRSIILFLNKQDLLAEKIQAGKSKLENYFPKFKTFSYPQNNDIYSKVINEPPEVIRAMLFIRNEFVRISQTKTPFTLKGKKWERRCYPHFTCAVDTENIKIIFSSCKDIIQRIYLSESGIL